MKRFGFLLDDPLYDEFYRLFPDYGTRSSLMRKCVRLLVKKARGAERVWDKEIEEVTNHLVGGLDLKERR
jgi:metal-responsive CopG/Arc/MetJ family transcriptional regulator